MHTHTHTLTHTHTHTLTHTHTHSHSHSHTHIRQGTEAIKTGKLEEAQAHYTAAKKASANLASNDEVLTQVDIYLYIYIG